MIDIGANLTDPVYCGIYHGTQKHKRDLEGVLARAKQYGVRHAVVTCGNLEEYEAAMSLMQHWPFLSCTIGYHPTRSGELVGPEFNPLPSADKLRKLICNRELPECVRAYGELGLDYDRLHFAEKNVQRAAFKLQLDIVSQQPHLPLFLHARNASDDFIEILALYKEREPKLTGVVHSFDGDAAFCQRILDLGFDIGINGCSLKTEDNLAVVRNIPLDRMHLETDCPWCEIRPQHASYQYLSKLSQEHFKNSVKSTSYDSKCSADAENCLPCVFVKGRTEPAHINAVAEVIAAISAHPFMVESLEERTAIVRKITAANSIKMFNLGASLGGEADKLTNLLA